MKDLITGLIIGILISGTAAKAVSITMDSITVYDMYCGFALCGVLSSTSYTVARDTKTVCDYAENCAKEMYKRRGK